MLQADVPASLPTLVLELFARRLDAAGLEHYHSTSPMFAAWLKTGERAGVAEDGSRSLGQSPHAAAAQNNGRPVQDWR